MGGVCFWKERFRGHRGTLLPHQVLNPSEERLPVRLVHGSYA